MKKHLFILFLLIGACHGMLAQIELGVTAGVGNSNNTAEVRTFTGNEDVSPEPLTSFYLGLSASKRLNDRLSFSPELLYSQRGNISPDPSLEIKTVVDYLALPLWLDYKMDEHFTFSTGAEFAYLLSQKVKFNDQSVSLGRDVNGKTTDIGILARLSYQIHPQWNIHVRATFGLLQQWRPWYINSQILDSQSPQRAFAIFSENVTQKSFFIGLGYTLSKK